MESSPRTDPATFLARREDVLEICYWYRGEGFGDRFSSSALKPFLPCAEEEIDAALAELVGRGELLREPGGELQFTDAGLRQAARLFADSFTDFQQSAHGECHEGCCEEEDHSRCSHG